MTATERQGLVKARQPKHNRRLTELLQQALLDIEMAKSEDQLVAVIERVRAFDGPLAYHFIWSKLLVAFAAMVALFLGFGYLAIDNTELWAVLVALVPCAMFALAGFKHMWSRNGRISGVAARLYQRNMLFDNGLRELDPRELPALEARLLMEFAELRRGNHSRKLMAGYAGRCQGDAHTFSYTFYHLHYVDRRTETSKDSKGNKQTRTIDTHHDRYGIVVPFPYVSEMAILSYGAGVEGLKGVSYQPSSNRFNRLFRVIAGSEMTAARFLKPTVVLACEAATGTFKDVNLEFNAHSSLCMSFSNGEWLAKAPQKYDFKTPDAFIAEVKECSVLPELQAALAVIHTLMVYSDSNFQQAGE